MTKLKFPSLPPYAEQVVSCVTITTQNPSVLKWVNENQLVNTVAKFPKSDDGDMWTLVHLHKCPEDEDSIHLHVELHREKPKDATASTLPRVSKRIVDFMTVANGEEVTDAFARVRVVVPRSEIPEYGTIAKLLNFRKKSCGKAVTLAAAFLDIDDEIFQGMRFSADDETNTVRVDLAAAGTVELEPGFLEILVRLLAVGIESFVFEGIEKEQPNAKGEV